MTLENPFVTSVKNQNSENRAKKDPLSVTQISHHCCRNAFSGTKCVDILVVFVEKSNWSFLQNQKEYVRKRSALPKYVPAINCSDLFQVQYGV